MFGICKVIVHESLNKRLIHCAILYLHFRVIIQLNTEIQNIQTILISMRHATLLVVPGVKIFQQCKIINLAC